MPPDPRKPTLPSESRCQRLAACFSTFAMTVLLLLVAAPPASAQNPTPGWEDGTIEVDVSSLQINEGGALSYRLRLTKPSWPRFA